MEEIIRDLVRDPGFGWVVISCAAGFTAATGYAGFHYVSDKIRSLRGYHENYSSDNPVEEPYKARNTSS